MAKKKRTNWIKDLYELNEKELAPGSEFMESIGIDKRPGPGNPRKEEGPFTLKGGAAAAKKKKQEKSR